MIDGIGRVLTRFFKTLALGCILPCVSFGAEVTREAADLNIESGEKRAPVFEAHQPPELNPPRYIELEAIVVYLNSKQTIARVQDDEKRVLTVELLPDTIADVPALRLGTRIRLKATPRPGKRSLQAHEIEILGQGSPSVGLVNLRNGAPTAHLGNYVEFNGTVQEICIHDAYEAADKVAF